jgi:N-acyl-D-amino-acid deacylase
MRPPFAAQVRLDWLRYPESRIVDLMFRLILAMVLLPIHGLHASPRLILKGGTLIDGTGAPPVHGDIEILESGRIGRIGGSLDGADSVSVQGLVVAPGFIDVHTHAENITQQPGATNFLRMGVTSLVLGNCGGSNLRVGKFFHAVDKAGISPNVATLIGHNTVRLDAMKGSFMRPPTEAELSEMKKSVDLAMREGAIGLSTGLIYLPGTFAKTDEIIALAKLVSHHGGIYVSHMRSEGSKVLNAIDELLQIARETGIPAHVSHIKAAGKPNWGRSAEILARLDEARMEGLHVTQDQYLYTASSTGISALIPQSFREGDRHDFKKRLADPALRSKIVDAMKRELQNKEEADYSYAVIASWKKDRRLDGLRLPEAAKLRRGSDSLDDQIELVFEIHSSGGASGVYHKMIEPDLIRFLQNPHTLLASDSSVRVWNSGVPHPRGYGNNARALARYSREQNALSLEEIVRRMTSLPARTFHLKDRGELRPGAWADIVVFDPESVRDNATFEAPHQYATGFRHVFVNGIEVISADQHLGTRPGKTLLPNR